MDNGYLASGSYGGSIKICDVDNGGVLKFNFNQSNGGHADPISALALLDTGYLVSGSNGTMKIWDLTIGKLKFNFNKLNGGHSDFVNSFVSLDNGYLATGSVDGTIKVWDIL